MPFATSLPKETPSDVILPTTLESGKDKKNFDDNVPGPSKFLFTLSHSARALESSSDRALSTLASFKRLC
jgi:hypothetical protein